MLEELKAFCQFPLIRELNLGENLLTCSYEAEEIFGIFGNIPSLKILNISHVDFIQDEENNSGISLWNEETFLEELSIKVPADEYGENALVNILDAHKKKLRNLKRIFFCSAEWPSENSVQRIKASFPQLQDVCWMKVV
jgi:hypothetical protein